MQIYKSLCSLVYLLRQFQVVLIKFVEKLVLKSQHTEQMCIYLREDNLQRKNIDRKSRNDGSMPNK